MAEAQIRYEVFLDDYDSHQKLKGKLLSLAQVLLRGLFLQQVSSANLGGAQVRWRPEWQSTGAAP